MSATSLPAPAFCQESFLLEGLSAAERDRVCRTAKGLTTISFCAGEKLINEGMPALGFYWVQSGHVKVIQPGGKANKKQVIKIVSPGELLGEDCVLSDGLFTYYAVALVPVQARFVPEAVLADLLDRCPQLLLNLTRKMALEVKAMEQRLLEASFYSCKERVARLLLAVADAFGEADPDGVRRVDWTREDLADMAGISIETAIRTLSAFEREGWLNVRYHTITLLNEGELRALVRPFELPALENVM